MSRFEQQLERGLGQIADRATPSPEAWASIQRRIVDQDPIHETEIIMLTDNTIHTKRWPLFAAAAAVVALLVGGLALINRDDGTEVPADTPTPTVAPTTVAPTTTVPETLALPSEGSLAPPGRYATDAFGVPASFEIPDVASSPWTVAVNNREGVVLAHGENTFVAIKRVGSFYDADQAVDPSIRGLGSIPPDGIDEWIAANRLIVDESTEVTVGGRTTKYRQLRIPAGVGGELCTNGIPSPCLNMISSSADQQGFNPFPTIVATELPGSFWIIDMDEFEPLGIWASTTDQDHQTWLDELAPMFDSIEFGDPAPAVEGGTARVPLRVTGNMTVTQTGERDINDPWPIERVGVIVGDINGTFTGTGISSPNTTEVTLDWTMDVTIDGLGTGTLTVRSDETWTDAAGRTAVDHVLSGTGDLEGVTGYGTTTHTDDGATYTATIELTLIRPTD